MQTGTNPIMKPAIEWLNEVGETAGLAMFSGKNPPGIELEELIARIQTDAAETSAVALTSVKLALAASEHNRIAGNTELLNRIEKLEFALNTVRLPLKIDPAIKNSDLEALIPALNLALLKP